MATAPSTTDGQMNLPDQGAWRKATDQCRHAEDFYQIAFAPAKNVKIAAVGLRFRLLGLAAPIPASHDAYPCGGGDPNPDAG